MLLNLESQRQYYEANPVTGDHLKTADWKRARKVLNFCQQQPPSQMLSVGCAEGYFMSKLAEKGWNTVGFDIVRSQLKTVTRNGLNAVLGNAEAHWPIMSNSMDLVIAADIIEHVRDTDSLLTESNRVLRLDGTLILTTPNIASLGNRLRILFGRYPRKVQYNLDGPGHLRYYTLPVLKRQLAEFGFEITDVAGDYATIPLLPRLPGGEKLVDDMGSYLPTLSSVLIVRAKLTRSNPN